MVWGWSRGSFIVVPTGADVAGTYSILSLILSVFAPSLCCSLSLSLSISVSVFLSVSPFFWPDGEMLCSKTFLTQDHNAPSHVIQPAISSLSLSLSLCLFPSISARSPSFSVSFSPPTKADKGLSFLLACLCLCVFVLYQTRLPLSLYSPPSLSKEGV